MTSFRSSAGALCALLSCLIAVSGAPVSGAVNAPANYKLGPGDAIRVQQANAEELDGTEARIDDSGYANLPLVGRIKAGGLTVEQTEAELKGRLAKLLLNPQPVVSITEYKSQPVSVLGAVNTPGVVQLQGQKSLLEVLSQAGGLRADAGAQLRITRHMEYGPLPLDGERRDVTGEFSIGTIDIAPLLRGGNPVSNIAIFPRDAISVEQTEMVYVTGDVHKPGGFPLGSKPALSVLQAVSLAEGLGPQASPKNAKVFRPKGDGPDKEEIAVDVRKILEGKANDFDLHARDVLFIPDSVSKKAGVRAAEAALQAATGVAIWRR